MTDFEIEILINRLQKAENRLRYLGQLRPLIPQEGGYSTAISFEQMSEYATRWMNLQAAMRGLPQQESLGADWEQMLVDNLSTLYED